MVLDEDRLSQRGNEAAQLVETIHDAELGWTLNEAYLDGEFASTGR